MNLKIDENIIYAFSKPPLFNPFSNNILDKKNAQVLFEKR
jgi:hypothetical protein